MSVYMIVYESPRQDYERFHAFAERFDSLKLSETTYAIDTQLDPRDVYQGLAPLLGQDDVAYVVAATEPWIGCGYEAMNDWMRRHVH